MKIRLGHLAAPLATLAVVAATASPAGATLAPSDRAPVTQAAIQRDVPKTTITLHVTTCRRCPVRLTQALVGHDVWQSASKRVHAGTVSFTVPTRRTHGATVSVAPRWQTLNALPLVAFRYANTSIGQQISNAVARDKKRGSPCWAGTDARSISMRINVVKYPQRTISGEPGYAIRVWSRTTRQATPPYLRTHKGTVATQEVVTCRT